MHQLRKYDQSSDRNNAPLSETIKRQLAAYLDMQKISAQVEDAYAFINDLESQESRVESKSLGPEVVDLGLRLLI